MYVKENNIIYVCVCVCARAHTHARTHARLFLHSEFIFSISKIFIPIII